MIARVTVLPAARRLIDSLRDIGYDLPAAVADIVDNSLTAGASRVDADFHFAGLDSWVRISDNGVGMAGADLDEAMRYGTQRTYAEGDLGRFGLGLKTASLSQCRRLTVASRRSPVNRRIEIRRWDLEHVAQTDRWEILRLRQDDVSVETIEPLSASTGTVVMWSGLDRLLDYRLPDGAAAERGMRQLAGEVRAYLEMVFHRFLAGEAKNGTQLTMTVNGEPLMAWDPYARTERHTKTLQPQSLSLILPTGAATMTIQPYLLPAQQRFSTGAAHIRASGPGRWNRQQGFYFYRNDRMIQAGGWSRLRTADEHTKLARIAVDVPEGAEGLLGINVAKMRVSIPRDLRGPMMAIATGVSSAASKTYRERRHAGPRSALTTSNASPSQPHCEPSLVAMLHPPDLDLVRILVGVVRQELAGDPDALRRVLGRLDRLPMSEGQALSRARVRSTRSRLRADSVPSLG